MAMDCRNIPAYEPTTRTGVTLHVGLGLPSYRLEAKEEKYVKHGEQKQLF